MPGLLAPVTAHAAGRKHLLHVLDHRRIATQHRVGVLGSQRNPDAALESAILDCLRNPAGEGVGIEWDLGDLMILLLVGFYTLASWLMVVRLRQVRKSREAVRGGAVS